MNENDVEVFVDKRYIILQICILIMYMNFMEPEISAFGDF